MGRQWPWVLSATFAVIGVAPALVIALLPPAATVPQLFVSAALCATASLLMAQLGSFAWRRWSHRQDLLFGDLMVWTWIRRYHDERRLDRIYGLLEQSLTEPGSVTASRRLWALERMTELVEARDAYTQRHSHRVARHATGIARHLGIPSDELARIRTAALLHDVGKICTPRSVLNKPGPLTEREFDVVKRHASQGADMINGLVEPSVVAMIRYHHERLGGNGYPEGLQGEEIPLGARIIAVADTFDAIISTRPYRPGRSHQGALEILQAERGTNLDADAVDAFISYYRGWKGVLASAFASSASGGLLPLGQALAFGGLSRTARVAAIAAVIAVPAVPTAGQFDLDRLPRLSASSERLADAGGDGTQTAMVHTPARDAVVRPTRQRAAPSARPAVRPPRHQTAVRTGSVQPKPATRPVSTPAPAPQRRAPAKTRETKPPVAPAPQQPVQQPPDVHAVEPTPPEEPDDDEFDEDEGWDTGASGSYAKASKLGKKSATAKAYKEKSVKTVTEKSVETITEDSVKTEKSATGSSSDSIH